MITGMTVKLTISLPDDLAEEVRNAVQRGRAPSVSAYIATAIQTMHENPTTLGELLNQWEVEDGPASPEAVAWAKEQLAGFGRKESRTEEAG